MGGDETGGDGVGGDETGGDGVGGDELGGDETGRRRRGADDADGMAPRKLYAKEVASESAVRWYLDNGGDVDAVPDFYDVQNRCCFAVCCFGRYVAGDYGQSEGPYDAKDIDYKCWGNDEDVGLAGLCGGNRTLLHWAAAFDKPVIVGLLIERGASLQAKSVKGLTPFDVAVQCLAGDETRRLLAGVPVERVIQGGEPTPLTVPVATVAASGAKAGTSGTGGVGAPTKDVDMES